MKTETLIVGVAKTDSNEIENEYLTFMMKKDPPHLNLWNALLRAAGFPDGVPWHEIENYLHLNATFPNGLGTGQVCLTLAYSSGFSLQRVDDFGHHKQYIFTRDIEEIDYVIEGVKGLKICYVSV